VHGPTPDVGEVAGTAVVAVVVVGGAVVGATVVDVDEAILVVPDEPHPRATIPARGTKANAVSRFVMSMTPSRS
jgi:hypothetical protein